MSKVALLCPVRSCHLPLAREERRVVCANKHSFDIARSGYVNLLQPQDKKSKAPGDTNDAVQARRRFLDRGFIDPLTKQIVEQVSFCNGQTLLEVGCGEGHHLAAFRREYGVFGYGTDISVPAIELAAKRHPDCDWTVANADRFLPYAKGSFDGVLSITARLHPEEFRRVLARDGWLLVVIPGADDLIELREAVLGDRVERDRVQRTVEMFAPLFRLEAHTPLRHVAKLDREALVDVMASSYRGQRERAKQELASLDAMSVTFSRDALLFREAAG